MSSFESLGFNCEFGLVQQHFGSEPLGLLRFARSTFEQLISAFESDFAGVGSPQYTELYLNLRGTEYYISDSRFGLVSHTFRKPVATAQEFKKIFDEQCRKTAYLKDKLLSDLRDGEKIFLYYKYERVNDVEAFRLSKALERYGENALFCIRQAEEGHRAGTVDLLNKRVAIGYIESFSRPEAVLFHLSPASWLTVCRAALRLLKPDVSGTPMPHREGAMAPFGPGVKIAREFQALVTAHDAHGPFLEIGVGPTEHAALLSKAFQPEERHAIGHGEALIQNGVVFHRGDPNDMRNQFEDGRFSTVFWNDALMHDPFFWRTLEEIRRVLAQGGVLIVAVSDFSKSSAEKGFKVIGQRGNPIPNVTITRDIRGVRPDYWRISPQAMRKTILNGYDVREVREAMMPSRVFGVGVKPQG